MDGHLLRAGVVNNESMQLELTKRRTDPPSKHINKPKFPADTSKRPDYPQHYGWNPVYWSDYPRQPMWTVPMPKIAAPMVTSKLRPLPTLPCHFPPTATMNWQSCPAWVPDVRGVLPDWNPYVDESNTPFKDRIGPPTI